MSLIVNIDARQILDSRGHPTVEVDLLTEQGSLGRASVPSGASTGRLEALELRDQNPKHYGGKSVHKAVDNVKNCLKPLLVGKEVCKQKELDQIMLECDGTPEKKHLGANSILGVSLAAARAGALDSKLPLYKYLRNKLPSSLAQKTIPSLPTPLMNLINGGKHASNHLDIQEFMIVPRLPKNFAENLRAGVEIFHQLKKNLSKAGHSTNVGDEGGVAPEVKSHKEAIEFLLQAIEDAGYRSGENVFLAIDSAASEFYQNGVYHMEEKEYSRENMIEYYNDLCRQYPIYSIEDGLDETDHQGWKELTARLGERILIVGDDLFVTNKDILANGIAAGEANAILIKMNQIGTLTETFDTLALASENNYKMIISHRSGETGDTFMADLAVACGCGHIKTGSVSRSDRTEKYNQLLRIEESL